MHPVMHVVELRGGGAPDLDGVPDHEAVLLQDVVPTGWFGADMADVGPGASVAVFGCRAVGLFAIVAARMRGASRIFAVDGVPARLERARTQGAHPVDFEQEDPVATILRLTEGLGVDRVIDTVAIDADPAPTRPRAPEVFGLGPEPLPEPRIARSLHDVPHHVLQWSVEVSRTAGTIAILGVEPPMMGCFPLGAAMVKQLKITMGRCPSGKYVPELAALVRTGALRPTEVLAGPPLRAEASARSKPER